MVDTQKLDIYLPIIDARDEEVLYQQASDVISAESRGQLNDFTDNSPAGVLLRAQVFTFAEMLFKINQLPLALLITFLMNAGVERVLGTKARVTLRFTLTNSQINPYLIPAGFQVSDSTGSFTFLTDTDLIIPAGQLTGDVSATAEQVGESYNLDAFTINSFTQPLTFLAEVVNLQPAQGGTNEEPIENTINRGISSFRRRNLVSAKDFSEAAEDILGANSKAVTIGNLAANKVSRQPGAIHIFCATDEGIPSNLAQITAVKNQLNESLMLGTSLYVSPLEFLDINCEVTVQLAGAESPTDVADALWEAFTSFLSLKKFPVGETVLIEEVRHALRLVPSVKHIDYILLNGGFVNVPMPNNYTAPLPEFLNIRLITEQGNAFEIGRGALDNLEQLV